MQEEINFDRFQEDVATFNILENVTRYCTKCYSEFVANSYIYLDLENYGYICTKCAKSLSQDLPKDNEDLNYSSLF